MIPSGLKGAARALPHPQLTAAARLGSVTCSASTQHLRTTTRTGHQRRLSSSKASCPPGDRSDGPRPAAAAAAPKATGSEAASAKSSPPRTTSGRQHGGRSQRGRKAKDESWSSQRGSRSNTWFSKLPSVPNTHSLSEKDLKLSSLFALHRPLSLTIPIPPTMEQAAFDKIFESSAPRPAHPADVVNTLSNTIESLEGGRHSDDLQWQVVQESPSNSEGIRHLDGAPSYQPRSVEEMVARLKPYEKPPPPTPMVSSSQHQQQQRRRSKGSSQSKIRREMAAQHQHQRAFETTVIIREHGPTMYSAELTSIKPLADEAHASSPSKRLRMSFGTRVRVNRVLRASRRASPASTSTTRPRQRVVLPSGARWQRLRSPTPASGSMLAISVKRQRKLKMKKHKYKKLMKRTRNLRRRLDK